ncbi:DUF881 domain-containing protein [Streptomyces durbertensis]|uniref:DUF881 domain-containing protein n=1 Tax=Streptomyces durbertensis TaxID=2448886 RepID=A0ABR6EB66_9ACTN|nr:DUF881 domain-containing protein [Streptomyces durbertensis]MBB1242556.1 DUF881 domain-containing protein [Streptomyces durbertensis]
MADEPKNPDTPEPERPEPATPEADGKPDVPADGRRAQERPEETAGAEERPRAAGELQPAERPPTAPSGSGPSGGKPSGGEARAEPSSGEPAAGRSAVEEPGPGGAEVAPAAAAPSGRQRLASGLWPPRINRNQLVVALLLFVLGLGLAIQVRQTSEGSALRGARQEDLVRILDELDDRTTRLEDEKTRLERQRSELENSSDQAEEARRQTRERERQLGVLAGTVAAQGPGIHFEIGDPRGVVEADKLLDAIQELRAAGAEAIQVNGVRVVAETFFSDASGGVRIDGRKVTAPYRFDVIGKPQDLEPALNIPGGVVQTLQKEQATVTIEPSEKIVVDALRTAKRPDYARSSSQ